MASRIQEVFCRTFPHIRPEYFQCLLQEGTQEPLVKPHEWRQLVAIGRRNQALWDTHSPRQVLYWLRIEPQRLETQQRQVALRHFEEQAARRGVRGLPLQTCPACCQKSLEVQFCRRSTGPGSKCVDVRLERCECGYTREE